MWKLPFEMSQEVQAHASGVTRLKLNNTNTHLFSVGYDGMLAMFELRDRDPKRDAIDSLGGLKFSQEILSDKT